MSWLDELTAPFRTALESGNFTLALLLVLVAGIATSFTPCVYPMIAITVSVFGAHEAKSRAHGALLSTAFVLGMAALFVPLGLTAALTGGVFGSLLASPYVLVGLSALFIAMAASMFGAFELALPPALANRLAQVGGVGFKGAFALGLVSAVIAAPCTGPVVSVLLAWVARTGNVAFGGAAFFAYAVGLGLLFWLVGTFSISLPKSGRWLDGVKSAFGVVMIVMALFYLRTLVPSLWTAIPKSTAFITVALVAAIGGVALGAIHLTFYDAALSVKLRKGAGIALSVIGLLGAVGWLEALPPGAKIAWLEDYGHAQRVARSSGKPLLVDFGASWCQACGELDRHTFSDPRVVAEGQRFVPVRIDLSPGRDSAEKREILRGYNQRGLPLVVMHASGGEEVTRVTSFVEPERFLQMMRDVQ